MEAKLLESAILGEQEERECERSFLSAMDAIGDAVLTRDSRGHVRFLNRAAEELTGWQQELALGHHATDVVHIVNGQEVGAERFCALLNLEGAPGSASKHECRVLAHDGVYHWFTIKTTSIAGADASSIRVVVMQDATKRKQTSRHCAGRPICLTSRKPRSSLGK